MMYTEGAMATNDMPEMEIRDPELPLKEEVCDVFDSSTIYESMQDDWRVSRVDTFEVAMPLMRSEPPMHATDSKDFDRDTVEEQTVKSYKKPMLDKKNKGPFIGEARKSRNGQQWSHLYQLAGSQHNAIRFCGDSLTRARDQLVMNARDKSGRGNLDVLVQRRLVDKHVDQKDKDCSEMMSGKKSVSSFSTFLRNRNVKGKEVVGGYPMNGNVLDFGQNGCGDKNKHPAVISPDASLHHSHMINQLARDCKGEFLFDLDKGVRLREWLKPGHSPMNKVERLSFLKKIVEVVDTAHSQGVVLQNLWPSSFICMPSSRVQYIGSSSVAVDTSSPCHMSKKRRIDHDIHALSMSGDKHQKAVKDKSQCQQAAELGAGTVVETDYNKACVSMLMDGNTFQIMGRQPNSLESDHPSEEKWYACPEHLAQKSCTTSSSNIYCLGLLAFELFCSFDSLDALSVAMLDVQQRIFPPSFLSENSKEAAFIMWLLHPEPSLRPTTREILASDLICESKSVALSSNIELPSVGNRDDPGRELLVEFLISLKVKQQEKASKLAEDIRFLEEDIKEAERRHLPRTSSGCRVGNEDVTASRNAYVSSNKREGRLAGDLFQLEKAYFSMRSLPTKPEDIMRSDIGLPKHTERVSQVLNESECGNVNHSSNDRLDTFFKGLCKFTRYSRFEVCGTIRNGEFINSTSAICSLSFDRYEDYLAAAGVSRKIKIFDVGSLLHESAEVNYPAVEMVNNSKLSCISWNCYIRNYLASTDYDGAVKIWDASIGTMSSQYKEHQKRAWSVDFSGMDPTKFATGSDDCSVKLWSANDKKSICTMWNPANICCVQFSPYSSHLLAVGSADYKIYGYDLRHTRVPWCTLSGHGKAVSFVKFMDPDSLVSASTDNTLKLWNLSKTSLSGLSSEACTSTFTGHSNEKNFVGLSVRDGYIACGSETNEVFAYHKFLPTPITSHKFGAVVPISGNETKEENNGLFVSSVCWRRKSNMVVAANSSGGIKILELV